MALRRVIAYFMHEDEAYAARQMLAAPQETESYFIGAADDAQIEALRARGIVVQELNPPEAALPADPATAARVSAFTRSVSLGARDYAAAGPPPHGDYYRVTLTGPLLEPWKQTLEQRGWRLIEKLSAFSYSARIPPAAMAPDQLADLDFVDSINHYNDELQFESASTRGDLVGLPVVIEAPPILPDGAPLLTYDLLLLEEVQVPAALKWLQDRAVKVAGSSGSKIRFYIEADSPVLFDLPDVEGYAQLEEYIVPRLHNDLAQNIIGLHTAASPFARLTGKGQTVGIADSGIDELHADFAGRVQSVPLGRPGDASDNHGHGTHVAGTVAGSGAASGGQYRGAAPEASIYFQSIMDRNGGLGGLPLNLGTLFEQAWLAGARVHNNSWGSRTMSEYRMTSREVDEFVAKRRDMLLVFSAGNDGTAKAPQNAAAGHVDWMSLEAPATSKNALAVGASCSDRRQGGYSELSHKEVWPADFPDEPIAAKPVSGDAKFIAGFSSRGPCDDYRVKPDLVAPGTDICSARSSQAPARNFWGSLAGSTDYAYMGGTSMAAPLVSGCAVLVRQYYSEHRNHEPSAALLKATLINSTVQLPPADPADRYPDLPNFHQGFGMLSMPLAIPDPDNPGFTLEFIDNWKEPAKHFQRTGQRHRYVISVTGGEYLRICLAYTDPPGRSIQNNLSLILHEGVNPFSPKLLGNAKAPLKLRSDEPDPTNNVEIIRIDNPPPGDYMLQVSVSNMLHSGQDYALVVSGQLANPLIEY